MQTRANQNLLDKTNNSQPWETVSVAGAAATGTLTITGDVSAAAESVTVGSTTMVTTPFDAGFITNAIDMQLLGITPLTNVQMASLVADVINGDPSSVPNVNIGQPSPSTEVTAVAAAGVVTVTAVVGGIAGNSIATTENLTNGSWGGSTLEGGEDVVSLQPVDLSDGSLKSSIWRGRVRSLAINLSSEKTDLYWEESGATIIPKSV